MKKIILILSLLPIVCFSQYRVGDHINGGIVVTVDGRTGMMISATDVPTYKAFYTAQLEAASAYRGGGFNDWRIPTTEEWMVIRELFRKYPIPQAGVQPETGLDPFSMYCAGEDYMINLRSPRNPKELAKTYYRTGTMYGNLRLVRNYIFGEVGSCPMPVGRLGDQYHGSTIFELSSDGQHGKVFSVHLGRSGWGGAYRACMAYQSGVWRLPTIDELLEIRALMIHFMDIGVMTQFKLQGVYWSSTQAGSQYMDLIFNWKYINPPGATSPTEPAYFRAVREF